MKRPRRNHGAEFNAKVRSAMPDHQAVSLDGLLSTGGGSRSDTDAPDRRAPSGPSVCWSPDAARSASAGRPFDWPAAGRDPDDAHGHHDGVWQAPHQHASPSASRLSLSTAPSDDRPAEPCLAADITYILIRRGFVYLCAIMDWASRRVLSWRLSNTLTTDFCLEAVQEVTTTPLAMAPRPSSTPTKSASSPAWSSPDF